MIILNQNGFSIRTSSRNFLRDITYLIFESYVISYESVLSQLERVKDIINKGKMVNSLIYNLNKVTQIRIK